MKTLLICHEGAILDHPGLSRWLASFSELTGVIVLRERGARMRRRIQREIKRVGLWRFLDVLAFRVYYKLFHARQDHQWEQQQLAKIEEKFAQLPSKLPILVTHSPNSPEAHAFVTSHRPDIVLARCKTLLKSSLFTIPSCGTFVMHPGKCPEYRNAHGCFWACANGEPENVAMTLLKINEGIDTGPVYGYYRCEFDERHATHIQIQTKTVLDNLDAVACKLIGIVAGNTQVVDTSACIKSAEWGQPWLTRWFRWKSQARKRCDGHSLAPLS